MLVRSIKPVRLNFGWDHRMGRKRVFPSGRSVVVIERHKLSDFGRELDQSGKRGKYTTLQSTHFVTFYDDDYLSFLLRPLNILGMGGAWENFCFSPSDFVQKKKRVYFRIRMATQIVNCMNRHNKLVDIFTHIV